MNPEDISFRDFFMGVSKLRTRLEAPSFSYYLVTQLISNAASLRLFS